MVLYPAVNAHRHHQVNSAPLRRLWGGPRPGSLEHRMGESSGPAEVLAPRVDLEGTVDFMKKWGGGSYCWSGCKSHWSSRVDWWSFIMRQSGNRSGKAARFPTVVSLWQESSAVAPSQLAPCGPRMWRSPHLWNHTHLEGGVWHRPCGRESHYLLVRKGF